MAIAGARHGLRGRGSFNVDIKFEGNWLKFNRIANSSPIIMAIGVREGQKLFAEEYRDKVKENMRNGGKRFGYAPLTWAYLYRKLRMAGGSTTFIFGETMVNSVEVKKNTTGTRFMVGIPKGLKRPNYYKESATGNRLQVHEYANILEQGNPRYAVPARPVFRDTFKQSMGGLRGLRKFIELHLIRRFGMSGIRVNKI